MIREIYLDNSATTRPYDEVIEFMNKINREMYGNPSSLHSKGIEAERLIKEARETIAGTLGVDSRDIYFTSGGTESNNLAIMGFLRANPRKGKHVITTKIEHPSVLEVCKHLSENGYKVDYIGVDGRGIIDLEMLKASITKDTALISVILVNNETGSVQPLDEIVRIKNSVNRDTAIHVDAVQAYGKLMIQPEKTGVDLLTASSHKIHGPKGVGALYVSRKVRVKPVIFGGGQESQLRSGTENVPGICGFGLAAKITFGRIEENLARVEKLKMLFIDKLKEKVDDFSVLSPEEASPYILSVSFRGIKAEVLLHHLEREGVYVSTGSACSSRKRLHSHVLTAMGFKACDIEGALRFSFSAQNTEEDVHGAVDALAGILPAIRRK